MIVRKLSLVAVLLLVVVTASAEEKKPNLNDGPMKVGAIVGAAVTITGETETVTRPEAWIGVNGPLVFGTNAAARVYANLGISAIPGETIDLQDVKTFNAANLDLGVQYVVGRGLYGDQELRTSVVAEWGFASRLHNDSPEDLTTAPNPRPAERLSRHYLVGVRFEANNDSNITIGYGRDEATGPRGWGQWMVYGQLALPKTGGIFFLTGDASLRAGPAEVGEPEGRDIFHLGVAADLGSLFSIIK